jgi:4-amino-4-deoxy-L-arabinose transferase-like glycosyltransferase
VRRDSRHGGPPRFQDGRSSARRSLVLLAILLTTGVALRFIGLTQPPLDFVATRQYHSVLIASNFFHDWWEVGSERDRWVAAAAAKEEATLEPPLLEAITATGFRLTGGEHLWLPRLLSILFWLGAAVLLYRLARRLATAEGALFAVAYFMFLPFGILASRAFQPDPLMIMLFLAAVLASVRYDEQPTLRRLGVAGGVAAAALLSKPGVLATFLLSVFLALLIARVGIRRAVSGFPLLAFTVLSLTPALAYYAYGTYVRNFLDGQVGAKIMPQLLADPDFWTSWAQLLERVLVYDDYGGNFFKHVIVDGVALMIFFVALVALLTVVGRRATAILTGLWVGYALFGLLFTYHIHTHDYYSLPVIPIVALSIAVTGDKLLEAARRSLPSRLVGLAVIVSVALTVTVASVVAIPRLTDPVYR